MASRSSSSIFSSDPASIALVGELLASLRYHDGPGPKQHGQNEPQHVSIPAVADAAKAFLQLLAGSFFSVAVVILGDQVIQHFLGDIGGEIRDIRRLFLGYEAKTLFAIVEDLGSALRSAAFRICSASSLLSGRDPISSLG